MYVSHSGGHGNNTNPLTQFLKRMFEDAVAQHHRILETYTDDDKVNFRLGHLMGVTDGKGFTGDKRTMRTLWNQIKVNFKQSSFEDWWDTIHNCTPRALYGELVSNNVIPCVFGLINLKRLPHRVCSTRKLASESQNSFPCTATLWRRCAPCFEL